MAWRFLAAGVVPGSAVCFRDADSLVGDREINAVEEWVASDRDVHIMRDHENHDHPIMGGMWGVRGDPARSVFGSVLDTCHERYFGWDMDYLKADIYPALALTALVHQDRPYYPMESGQQLAAFHGAGGARRFVGQGFNSLGVPRRGHDSSRIIQALRRARATLRGSPPGS